MLLTYPSIHPSNHSLPHISLHLFIYVFNHSAIHPPPHPPPHPQLHPSSSPPTHPSIHQWPCRSPTLTRNSPKHPSPPRTPPVLRPRSTPPSISRLLRAAHSHACPHPRIPPPTCHTVLRLRGCSGKPSLQEMRRESFHVRIRVPYRHYGSKH